MPPFFDRYIQLAEDIDIREALRKQASLESLFSKSTCHALDGLRYAPDKWTIRDILQHIIDNERVQAYRALRISRKDTTPLPGYDEQLFANHAEAVRRSIDELFEEFDTVRRCNIMLFDSFTDDIQMQEGNCNQTQISVLALGFVLVGHPIHHASVLRERYLPLIQK